MAWKRNHSGRQDRITAGTRETRLFESSYQSGLFRLAMIRNSSSGTSDSLPAIAVQRGGRYRTVISREDIVTQYTPIGHYLAAKIPFVPFVPFELRVIDVEVYRKRYADK